MASRLRPINKHIFNQGFFFPLGIFFRFPPPPDFGGKFGEIWWEIVLGKKHWFGGKIIFSQAQIFPLTTKTDSLLESNYIFVGNFGGKFRKSFWWEKNIFFPPLLKIGGKWWENVFFGGKKWLCRGDTFKIFHQFSHHFPVGKKKHRKNCAT